MSDSFSSVQFFVRPIIGLNWILSLDCLFRLETILILRMSPFWKKPTLQDQVIELKMSSRMLNSQYKKCMQESANYEKKVRAVHTSPCG